MRNFAYARATDLAQTVAATANGAAVGGVPLDVEKAGAELPVRG